MEVPYINGTVFDIADVCKDHIPRMTREHTTNCVMTHTFCLQFFQPTVLPKSTRLRSERMRNIELITSIEICIALYSFQWQALIHFIICAARAVSQFIWPLSMVADIVSLLAAKLALL